jgi:hypothetical protein
MAPTHHQGQQTDIIACVHRKKQGSEHRACLLPPWTETSAQPPSHPILVTKASLTKDHRLDGLQSMNLYFKYGGWKSKIRILAGLGYGQGPFL